MANRLTVARATAIFATLGVASGVATSLLLSRNARPNEAPSSHKSLDAGAVLSSATEDLESERRKFEKLVSAHESEPIDEAWASFANATYDADLNDLGPRAGFEVLDIDCRSRSCAATLRWMSWTAMAKSRRLLFSARFVMRCGVAVFAPPPADVTASYDLRVMFPSCAGRP